uniref:Secreted protein n=1 Tax=Panagrolaimus sp. ES5 TaxID=591445 RepID=A0AC34FGK7_9BILA
MNELIAILLCVFVCCGMFLLWLVSMATCPDRMVNLISGGGGESKSSSSTSRNESCELVSSSRDEESGESSESPEKDTVEGINFCKPARRTDSKKLSVVPEQDEQLTLQSVKSPIRPTIYDAEELYSVPTNSSGARLISRFSESHIDKYEVENEIMDDDEDDDGPPQPYLLQPVTLPARIPLNSGGPVAVNQPYSQIGDRFFKCYSVGYVNQPELR